MALPLPHPSALLRLTRNTIDQTTGAPNTLAGLPARALDVLDSAEALVRRIATVLDRVESVLTHVESTLNRTDQIVDVAEKTVEQVQSVTSRAVIPVDEATRITSAAGLVVTDAKKVADRAAATMAAAEKTMSTVDGLLAAYADTLRKGAPMANRFVEQLTPEEVDAAIRLIDELPRLTGHLTSDVLPILATLDRVGPDIHDLLDVTRDLKLAIAGIPGLAMLRRRGEALSAEG
ncbi:hypothetical protein [Plantactinospora endophytica]|uniref:Ribulose 1,5-bisphosphate carboxylase large subunit n=1 Tax=Plantactinospora endophytica TaxID=673535 RepID=A0ABQ4EED7_9ACTN|nr:hypothetical protein [Plantactinospora endophytica]GIG93081.1 hypothetical protein Pen02_80170 [Plantactinospora endophytica]